MKTKLTLKPGQHGTKAWVDKYGDRLVSVRYRYDEETQKRYKTVELIVESSNWVPEQKHQNTGWCMTDILGIKIGPFEKELQEQVKRAGGIWRPRQKLWELSYAKITALGLENRINVKPN